MSAPTKAQDPQWQDVTVSFREVFAGENSTLICPMWGAHDLGVDKDCVNCVNALTLARDLAGTE